MGNILTTIDTPAISYSDNFKVWIDRFNDIAAELTTTNFATEGEYVDLQTQQTINGNKTFGNLCEFNSNVIIGGNLNLSGTLLTSNTSTKTLDLKYSIDGNINFIGKNGIRLVSNASEAADFSLSFDSPTASSVLNLNFTSTYAFPTGTFKIKDNINLEVESAEIILGDSTWNFPTLPTETSILRYAGGSIEWQTNSDLATSLAIDLANSIALVNTTERMPVGTIIDVDKTKISNDWNNGLSATGPDEEDFYGWLIINGQTLTAADENSDFAEIVNLINPPVGTPIYPRTAVLSLTNTTGGSPAAETVKLIKYLPDAVARFEFLRGNGISFFDVQDTGVVTTTQKNIVNLKSGTTHVELNVNITDFDFQTGGKLALKSNVVRRDINGNITTVIPTADDHAATKSYVDLRISTGGVEGSVFDLMESSDGLGYSDSKNSLSIVDKSGAGRVWRTVATSTLFSSSVEADVTLNSISPFGTNFGKVTQLQKTFATPDQFFFVDEDDAIYGYGTNSRGDIAATNPARGVGDDFSDYYNSGYFPANPYSTTVQVRQLLPAFLPIKQQWSANVVLFDSVTGISGSNDNYTNVTIKTKDGYDNQYVQPTVASSGLVSYFNGNQPYTRGYYISTGLNDVGQLGRGNDLASANPQVWGPLTDQPGRFLWYNFALTEEQKTSLKTSETALTSLIVNSPTTREQIRKRFNWFKPNAVTTGGLTGGLTEWRTETGLLPTDTFESYSWYIKKVVRTYDAHYVIVGKPGNEADNEVWCAGRNRNGAFGNIRAGTTEFDDFMPMYRSDVPIISSNTFTRFNSTNGFIFKRWDNAAHELLDFDTLQLGASTLYYVILGDLAGANRTTQFRLFNSFDSARKAFISNSVVGAVSLTTSTTTGINSSFKHFKRLKGIIDISVSRGGASDTSGDGIILRQITSATNPLPSNLLDAIPEQNILSDNILVCGLNTNGRLGTNDIVNYQIANGVSYSGGTRIGTKIIKKVTCSLTSISFMLTDNGILYFAGNRASGCANSGSAAAGNITQWTNVGISHIHDFFVIDDAARTRIFIIAETGTGTNEFVLWSGGFNSNYILGTSVSLGVATPRYAKIIFPENPKNIVNIAGAMDQTYILCKDQGEDIGRVYVTGRELLRSYFPVSSGSDDLKTFPQFKKIDRDIL